MTEPEGLAEAGTPPSVAEAVPAGEAAAPAGDVAAPVEADAAPADQAAALAPGVAEAVPAPSLRAYELPGPRRVVIDGLQLASAGSAELRRASVYIGLLSLGLLGPVLIYGLAVLVHFRVTDVQSLDGLFRDPAMLAAFLGFEALAGGALLGWLAVTIDGRLIAVSLLAARAGDQAFTLRQATIRARQAFWRVVAASALVGIVSLLVQLGILLLLGDINGSNQGASLIATFITTLVVAPFGYVATGIVLGDVGATEAIRRSVRLARARPTIALVVALFAFVASAIQTFALSAGLEVVVRVGQFLHLGVDAGWLPLALIVIGILAFVVALGSLVFTVSAIVVAPQVAAFLGLTFYSGGLDRARRSELEHRPSFRWITLPMVALMGILALGSAGGIASLDPFRVAETDPIVGLINSAADGAQAVVRGADVLVHDPENDGIGPEVRSADITAADYAFVSSVPPWLIDGVFDCAKVNVACSASGDPAAFDDGALLVLVRLAAPPDSSTANFGRWGVMWRLNGYGAAPAGSGLYARSSEALITTLTPSGRSIRYQAFANGSFEELTTFARSTWSGNMLLTLIPNNEIGSEPIGWDAFASSSDRADGATSVDSLRESDSALLLPFKEPPRLAMTLALPTPKR
jgi:hypothetical protein